MSRMLLVLLAVMVMCCGCKTTDYLINRGRDAADIVTVTGGYGVGFKARLGSIHAGLIYQIDKVGLRGGKVALWDYSADVETMIPLRLPHGEVNEERLTAAERFEPVPGTMSSDRGKHFRAQGTIPCVTEELRAANWRPNQKFHPYYTQIEIAGGLGLAARVGVNFGELLDFIVGLLAYDILDDDIERED